MKRLIFGGVLKKSYSENCLRFPGKSAKESILRKFPVPDFPIRSLSVNF